MAYLRLIRPINLLLIALVQLVIKFGLLEVLNVQVALNYLQFALLIFATCCIAAGGNVINDVFDIEIDRINKPDKVIVGKSISEKSAYRFYILLNVLGVGAGFYLSNTLDKPVLATVFIICSFLLYMYASNLKSMLLVGNLVVSALVSMSLLVVVMFDIFPAINTDQMDLQVKSAQVILGYAVFAFIINLMREWVKDLQDIDGDRKGGRNTLPIAIGRSRTVTLVFVFGCLSLITILIHTYYQLFNFQKLMIYVFAIVAAPLLFFCIKAFSAATKKEFGFLSILLKLIMVSGIGSLIFYSETLAA